MEYPIFRCAARLVPGLVIALAACKSGGSIPADIGTGGAPPELNIRGATGVGGGSVSYRVNNSNGGITGYVRATPDEAWKTLLVTYNDLKLPVTTLDASGRQISSSDTRAPRTLGGKPLGDYLDCGSGISGPRVESYDVAYTLVSVVMPAGGDSTAVQSSLVASASSRGGSSSAPVDCVTTGRLEKRLAQLVRLKLGR
jgi:hypothetical protein